MEQYSRGCNMTDGSFANKTGNVAERIIRCILSDNGYDIKRQQPIGLSIYQHRLKCDFFISNVTGYPNGLIIESKWQDVGGSADEKFPYLVKNIKEKFPCPAIVVVGGNGCKQGAFDWLKDQVDDKLIAVLTVEEFTTYVNRKLPSAQKITKKRDMK